MLSLYKAFCAVTNVSLNRLSIVLKLQFSPASITYALKAVLASLYEEINSSINLWVESSKVT